MMNIYPIKVNNFFHLVEKLCFLAKIKNTKSVFSKKMYGNIKLTHSIKKNASRKKFDKTTYNQQSLIESINPAIKQTLGGFVRARNASQQQKTVVLKALAYNIEHINKKIKITLFLDFQ